MLFSWRTNVLLKLMGELGDFLMGKLQLMRDLEVRVLQGCQLSLHHKRSLFLLSP